MTEQEQFNTVLERLRSGGTAIRCEELADLLTVLGFEVRDGKKAGHKVFVHHGIETFTSGGYTCGHGRNPQIKSVYIRQIAKLLKQYEMELIQYSGEHT